MPLIHREEVKGVNVDSNTRCEHYHSDRDIVAIKFKCCGDWFPCFQCHEAVAGHDPEVWPIAEFDTRAIMCGWCGAKLPISEYMALESSHCPACLSRFNPGCANHYDLYFEA